MGMAVVLIQVLIPPTPVQIALVCFFLAVCVGWWLFRREVSNRLYRGCFAECDRADFQLDQDSSPLDSQVKPDLLFCLKRKQIPLPLPGLHLKSPGF